MEDGVGAAAHPFDPDLAAGGIEQGQLLGRPLSRIFMGIPDWLAHRMPVGAGIRNRLVGTGFVLGIDRQHILGMRGFDQVFFAVASGSMTVKVPLLRLRMAVPVSHQLRSRSQVNSASWRTHQML
jgi:hypothetical protein